ncbi:MAG: hypothetical protein AAGH45_04440 [Pseudomonadota bacterium]
MVQVAGDGDHADLEVKPPWAGPGLVLAGLVLTALLAAVSATLFKLPLQQAWPLSVLASLALAAAVFLAAGRSSARLLVFVAIPLTAHAFGLIGLMVLGSGPLFSLALFGPVLIGYVSGVCGLFATLVLDQLGRGQSPARSVATAFQEGATGLSVAFASPILLIGLLTLLDRGYFGPWLYTACGLLGGTAALFGCAGLLGALARPTDESRIGIRRLLFQIRERSDGLALWLVPGRALGSLLLLVLAGGVGFLASLPGGSTVLLSLPLIVSAAFLSALFVMMLCRSWRVGLAYFIGLMLVLTVFNAVAGGFGAPGRAASGLIAPAVLLALSLTTSACELFYRRFVTVRATRAMTFEALRRTFYERGAIVMSAFGLMIIVALPALGGGSGTVSAVGIAATVMALLGAVMTLFVLPGLLLAVDMTFPELRSVRVGPEKTSQTDAAPGGSVAPEAPTRALTSLQRSSKDE